MRTREDEQRKNDERNQTIDKSAEKKRRAHYGLSPLAAWSLRRQPGQVELLFGRNRSHRPLIDIGPGRPERVEEIRNDERTLVTRELFKSQIDLSAFVGIGSRASGIEHLLG